MERVLGVDDRWHLWHNLGEAVERAVTRHREHLPAAAGAQVPAQAAVAAATPPEPAPSPAVPRSGRIADRTRARHAEVHRMLADGRSVREVTAALRLSRNTVRRFARAASPEELLVNDGTGRRPSILDEHVPYLRERWNSRCTNAAQLWQGDPRPRLATCGTRSTTLPSPHPFPSYSRSAWLCCSTGGGFQLAVRCGPPSSCRPSYRSLSLPSRSG